MHGESILQMDGMMPEGYDLLPIDTPNNANSPSKEGEYKSNFSEMVNL